MVASMFAARSQILESARKRPGQILQVPSVYSDETDLITVLTVCRTRRRTSVDLEKQPSRHPPPGSAQDEILQALNIDWGLDP